MRRWVLALALTITCSAGALLAGAVSSPPAREPLRVAAAADLALAFEEVGRAYQRRTGQQVVLSLGSTGLLAKQIEQGAPFDVFAAANVSFTDEVIRAGACLEESRTRYARGRIVVFSRRDQAVVRPRALAELAAPRFVKIAIANPAHAPYGRAAMQALERAGLAERLRPRLVYGENVLQTLQFASSGNAEAALVALSLAVVSDGDYLTIDEKLHEPIDQAMVVCGRDPRRLAAGRAFTAFVSSKEGRAIMRRFGFLLPGEVLARKQ